MREFSTVNYILHARLSIGMQVRGHVGGVFSSHQLRLFFILSNSTAARITTAIKTSVKGNLSRREKKNSRLFVHSLFDYIFPADLVFSFKLHQKSYTDIKHCDLLVHVVVCSYVNVVWTPLNHVTKLASSQACAPASTTFAHAQTFDRCQILINPLNPKSDKHLISPYSNTAESFIKVMRLKEIIFKLWNFDC